MTKFIKQKLATDDTIAFDARDIILRCTCDLITNCVFASDAKAFESEKPEMLELCKTCVRGIMESVQSTRPKKMIPLEAENEFIRITKEAIEHRIKSNTSRDDFLSLIISVKHRKGQNEIEAAAHAWTFFLDAFETSAIVASHAFLEIAKDYRVQEKLRAEIVENLDEDGNLSYEKIESLEYLDQVFYEVLRLHPPFMFTTKVCSEKIEIDGVKGHKFLMKKGSTVLISMYSVQRDPGKLEVESLSCE